MKKLRVWVGALSFLGIITCASQTRLPEPVRVAVQTRHVGRMVELRQSCFYGDLYDENELWLLSPYPFAATSHIDDLNGRPMHPHKQLGQVAAGTKLVVDRVEFPDSWAMTKRMLTTPRYNPWVYLRSTPDDPHLPSQAKTFVWILPLELNSEESVEAAIAKAFAPDGEMQKWLEARRPTVRVAIEHKDMLIGMSSDELTAAMGDPLHWFKDTREGQLVSVAWYPQGEAWIDANLIVDIKPSRALSSNSTKNSSPGGPGAS